MKYSLIGVALLFLFACGSSHELQRLDKNSRILSFGDSLTYGVGADTGQSYPAVLQMLIDRQVINAGVPGELSAQGLLRLPKLLDKYQPSLLILCHGANDILRRKNMDSMAENITAMIDMAQDRGIEVVLLGVPRFGLFFSSAEEYKMVAIKTNVLFIEDLLPNIISVRALKADAVHPNKEGYRQMAGQIYAVLQAAGAVD